MPDEHLNPSKTPSIPGVCLSEDDKEFVKVNNEITNLKNIKNLGKDGKERLTYLEECKKCPSLGDR